jgi:clan AA aspartic protease
LGTTTVNIKVCRIDKPEICADVRDAVVDTGATVSAIPEETARKLGINFTEKRSFTLADGSTTVKAVGHALVEINGERTADDVIVTKGSPLLGVTAMEHLGYAVDPNTKTLKKQASSLLL